MGVDGLSSRISACGSHFWLLLMLCYPYLHCHPFPYVVCLLLGYYHMPILHLGFAYTPLDSSPQERKFFLLGLSVLLGPACPFSSLSPTGSSLWLSHLWMYHPCRLTGCEDWGFHSPEKDSQVSARLPWARGTFSRIVLELWPCGPSLALSSGKFQMRRLVLFVDLKMKSLLTQIICS